MDQWESRWEQWHVGVVQGTNMPGYFGLVLQHSPSSLEQAKCGSKVLDLW